MQSETICIFPWLSTWTWAPDTFAFLKDKGFCLCQCYGSSELTLWRRLVLFYHLFLLDKAYGGRCSAASLSSGCGKCCGRLRRLLHHVLIENRPPLYRLFSFSRCFVEEHGEPTYFGFPQSALDVNSLAAWVRYHSLCFSSVHWSLWTDGSEVQLACRVL